MAGSTSSNASNTAVAASRNPAQFGCAAIIFEAQNHSTKAARKIASTNHGNGGQAITIIANPNHPEIFRIRSAHPRFKRGEINATSTSKAAPGYRESPDAKYKTTECIVQIVSSFDGSSGCHSSRRRDQRHLDERGLPGRVVDALRRYPIVAGLSPENIGDESLRIAVVQREPARLNLHHDAVARQEHVICRG